MLSQSFGKGAAAFNRSRQFSNHLSQSGVFLLLFQHAHPAQQWETGIHERGKLPSECSKNLRLNLSAQPGNPDIEIDPLFRPFRSRRCADLFLFQPAFSFGFSASVTLVGKYPISFSRLIASFWLATSRVPLVSLPRESMAT